MKREKLEAEKVIEKKKILTIAMWLSVIMIISIISTNIIMDKFQPPKKYNMAELYSEFIAIDHWKENYPEQQAEIINTDDFKSTGRSYLIKGRIDDVILFYHQELQSNNWKLKNKKNDGTNWEEIYCKETLMASLKFMPLSEKGIEYKFSMSTRGEIEEVCQ